MLTSRGLGRVLGDLATLGFNAEWGVLGAADVGAPHQRDRIWIVGYSTSPRLPERQRCAGGAFRDEGRGSQSERRGGKVADPNSQRLEKQHTAAEPDQARQHPWGLAALGRAGWWTTEPPVGRVVDGLARRVDRLKCLGNGQVPLCAAGAWRRLTARIEGS